MRLSRLLLAIVMLITILPTASVSANAPQGSTAVNLAYGAKYTVTADMPNAIFRETEYKTYPGPVDGLASNLPTWTGFARQDGREIEVDLGEIKKIEEISFQFKQDVASAITLPPYVRIEVSQDGQKWSTLGQMYHSVSPTDTEVIERTFQLVFSPVQARYVKINFPVDIWVFMRHLKIMGDQNSQGGEPVLLPNSNDVQTPTGSYMNIPNTQDILLIYTGAHEEKGTWNKDELKSVVAYMKDGTVKGKMFDTILFLPYADVPSTQAGWTAYIEDLFQSNSQLGALNQVAGEVYQQSDFKEKVILSIPFPDTKTPDFWTEQGKEGTDTIEGQKQAIKWYMEKLMEKWNQAEYKHLELAGIYWWKEKIETNVTDEEELVKTTASLVHQYNLPFYWIPYYGAKGYTYWKELGFDHVIIQPNYYAKEVPTDDRMKDIAGLMNKFHMAVEVEIDEWVLVSRYYYDAFYKQLDQGHELGFDQKVTNAYYAGSKTIPSLANSEIPAIRKIYDDLYLWMQGKYQPAN